MKLRGGAREDCGRYFKKNLFPQDFYMQMRHCRCSTPALRRLNPAPARAVTDLHSAFCVSYSCSSLLSLFLSRFCTPGHEPAETRAVSLVLLMIRKCRRARRPMRAASDPGKALVDDGGVTKQEAGDRSVL